MTHIDGRTLSYRGHSAVALSGTATFEAVAAAFGVGCYHHPEAMAAMAARYKPGEFNEARKRMAYIPVGAELVRNTVSTAPGVHIGNVFVMAGVPMIMRAMMDAIEPRLQRGAIVHVATVQCRVSEGRLAEGLGKIQADHKDVSIGSYPFYREDGNGVQLVARGRDAAEVETAMSGLKSATGFIQSLVAARLQTRFTPLLQFVLDEGVKRSIEMTRLINEALGESAKHDPSPEESGPEELADGTAAPNPAGT